MGKGKPGVKRKEPYLLFSGSIRSKLLLSYLVTIFIPMLILGVYSMKLLDDSLKESSLSAEKENMMQLADNAKYYLNSCVDLSENICFDSKIWAYFFQRYSYPVLSTEGYYNLIRPVFTRYLTLKKEIEKMTVYTKNETMLYNNSEIAYVTVGSPEDRLYGETLNSGAIRWKLQEDSATNEKIILMTRMLNLNNVNVGMLAVYIKENQLYTTIREQLDGSNTYLVTPDGMILTSTDRQAIGRSIDGTDLDLRLLNDGVTVDEIRTDTGTVRRTGLSFTLRNDPDREWLVIKTVPMQSILSVASATKTYLVLEILLLLFSLAVISVIMSGGITKRIKELVSKMKRVERGDFKASVSFEGRDEIAYMGNVFNTMVARLDELVRQVYEMQLAKKDMELKNREAQLKMLQSQINPHYLFNTLDAVLYGIENNREGTAKIIELLANNFRRNIQWQENLITVEEEMIFIKEFLAIQKFRMQDRLEWYADVSAETLSCRLPKMILQPLVENAIYHGISLKKDKGRLYLSIRCDQEFLYIKISDDGVGVEKQKLEEIRETIRSNEVRAGRSHIGLKNVYDRIRLYYGDHGSLTITSEINRGTVVEMKLPI